MKITVKHLSDTKIALTILVSKDELDAAEQVALTKLSKSVKAPGFRVGKVPSSVAAKYVNPQALAEQTLDDALSKAVSQAFVDEKIPALDRPQIDIKKYVPGQELEFVAEAEILPTVVLGKYKKMGIKKNIEKVTEKDINEVVDRMRKGFAKRVTVDRLAKRDDEVVIDFTGKRDGVVFDGGSSKDYTLSLGSNQFIPGFEEAIVGHKKGDIFEVPLKFPDDYHAESLAGADVVFTVAIKDVKKIELPKLDDDFAKTAGPFKTLQDLKSDIKRELGLAKEREAVESFKDALVEKLISLSKVPVPDVLLSDQMKSIEQDMSQNLMYQGMTLDMYLKSKGLSKEDWLKTEVKSVAEKRVKAGLVLSELSKAEKITASDEELAAQINKYQEQYGNRSGQDFTSPEMQRDIANRLLTEKTVERLVQLNQ